MYIVYCIIYICNIYNIMLAKFRICQLQFVLTTRLDYHESAKVVSNIRLYSIFETLNWLLVEENNKINFSFPLGGHFESEPHRLTSGSSTSLSSQRVRRSSPALEDMQALRTFTLLGLPLGTLFRRKYAPLYLILFNEHFQIALRRACLDEWPLV